VFCFHNEDLSDESCDLDAGFKGAELPIAPTRLASAKVFAAEIEL
jgi:hypothetical protein